MESEFGTIMTIEEYRKNYLEDVKTLAASESEFTVTAFVKHTLENLEDFNIVSDFELAYEEERYGNKMYRVDAFAFDEYDMTMSIFIANYSGESEIETLTRTEATALFNRIMVFCDGVLNGKLLYQMEISTPLYDFAERLKSLQSTIRRYRFFILTDKQMSGKITQLQGTTFNNIPVEYNIWDIQRLYKVASTGEDHEPVEINFKEEKYFNMGLKYGLPCIEASDASTDEFKCLLCVVPGSVLADLYDTYGSVLLEGNVRAFLSVRGKVNKNIRKTILGADGEDKRMFFAYNNGISATAAEAVVESHREGYFISSIKNLQIVNGGQTTASLSNAKYKDKADLNGIYVQMKLTVIPNHELAQQLIPKISRGANSQNKVSDADFFSNHEFNIKMEKISRTTYAPAKDGQQFETHWFFERARGQYEQEQSKLTQAQKNKYLLSNPKEQKITKTDFAKYRNSWEGFPHYASKGAQKNFMEFAERIVNRWDKDQSQFNDAYFRDTVAIAILYKYLDKMVAKQSWYSMGYKANTVMYTLAYFNFLTAKQFHGRILNLQYIWDKQGVPEELETEFISLSKYVYDHLTSEKRLVQNVTEWAKRSECWESLKDKDYKLNKNIADLLLTKDEQKIAKREGKKEDILRNGIEVQTAVVEKGAEYWAKMIRWGIEHHLVTERDISFLKAAANMNTKIPSEKQCQRILNIESRFIDEGFSR